LSSKESNLVEFFKKVNPEEKSGGAGALFWIVGLIGAGGIFGGLRVLGRKRTKRKSGKSRYLFDRTNFKKFKWRG